MLMMVILFLNSKNEMCTALNALNKFGKLSGLVLNVEKYEGYWLDQNIALQDFVFKETIATRLWQVYFYASSYISSIPSKALLIGSNGKTNPILKYICCLNFSSLI